MKVKLIGIGRNMVSEEIDMKKPSWNKIYKAVKKHLLSRGIDIAPSDQPNTFNVFAGFRGIGQVWVEHPELLK